MFRILSLFLLIVGVASFSPISTQQPSWGRMQSTIQSSRTTTTSTTIFMFNINDKEKAPALQTFDASVQSVVDDDDKAEIKNVVRDMNTGEIKEVKWVDPAMRANTRPWEMSWWAYIAFGFPFIVLLNDFLHFLPTDGPIGFLGRI